MISLDQFIALVDDQLSINLRDESDAAQYNSVVYEGDDVLQIVAGPGSGKTTTLALRALRHVFVDGILPENILITTFTRKAAREIRSRWLIYGSEIQAGVPSNLQLDGIDLNRCMIDTLDSVVQQVLTDNRPPGTLAPVVADTSASNLILRRGAFGDIYADANMAQIGELLGRYTFDEKPPRNRGEALITAKVLLERLVQDCVDLESYAGSGVAEDLMAEMLRLYRQNALDTNVFDFALLEDEFLRRLADRELEKWRSELDAVLVDEYQDTNPLQEAIYYEIVGNKSVSATIVGDDDQALYRFRGGSVELFTEFRRRCFAATGRETERVDMVRNFRSTPEIVKFYNNHISGDPDFSSARIVPSKPAVVAFKSSDEFPVLGMFRPDQETLAKDLAEFLAVLVNQRRVAIGNSGLEIRMPDDGQLGDAVFLAHSVREVSYDRYNSAPRYYFPSMLRDNMESRSLQVFNPRGQALTLRFIPEVQVLLGLMLLAIDPDDSISDGIRTMTNEAKYFLNRWRESAQEFINSNPSPNDGAGIGGFIRDWQGVATGGVHDVIPHDWPILEMLYTLLTWMPEFQRSPEHQVWLEAITRIVSSGAMESPYEMRLLQNTQDRENDADVIRSRASFIRDALMPIAEDVVDVDEDIVPSVPRDRLEFMTIHQAKGLEFPLVIVDVGSRFRGNYPAQRFMRFPDKVSNVVRAEDDVEPHLVAPIRGMREPIDRTFDDLVRLYYVAYSRPQSALMLIGNESCLRYAIGAIPNIALGWNRDGQWPWRQSYTGRKPVKVEPPFREIQDGTRN